MAGLVQTVHGHLTWLDYHKEELIGSSEEANENMSAPLKEDWWQHMVDDDRTILMREKMNLQVFGSIR